MVKQRSVKSQDTGPNPVSTAKDFCICCGVYTIHLVSMWWGRPLPKLLCTYCYRNNHTNNNSKCSDDVRLANLIRYQNEQ